MAAPSSVDDGEPLRQLRAESQRLADFARASGDWLWETDAALKLVWLSDSFSAVTGEPAAAYLGRNVADAHLFDDAGRAASAASVHAALQQHSALTRVVALLPTSRGALKVSHSAVPFFDATGVFAGYRGTARDVTAQVDAETRSRAQAVLLRQSDERLEMAASATGIGIAELDVASGALQFDERACLNHGLAFPALGYTLADWLQAIHPDDRAAVQAALDAAVAGSSALEFRYRLQRPDGAARTLEIVARATAGRDGRAEHMVGTCRDVTQQVAHEQLRRDKESAERANRAKSQFLSRMSHELRTPLNSILGFAQLMTMDRLHPLATDQQKRLASVHRAGRHLLGLINDALELARIEREDFSLQLEAVDLVAALHDCLALIAPLARENQVGLPTLAAAPCWVRADRRALEQVLMNLLSNAIKYNSVGGQVRAALRAEAGTMLLSVSDEGAGLSAQQQARLFQHFERLGAEAGRVEGTGLGLVITRQLVQAMGAELRVQSQPGFGSTFTLVLPAAPPPQAAPPTAASPTAAIQVPTGRQRKVLYIEDERLNVVLMEELFRTRAHWQLRVAENGAEGLALARQEQPDLLLVDMNLPDTTGLVLIRTLRADPATRPLRCIALSADAMDEQIEKALAAGFDAYWTKPIDVGRVLADLARLLE